MSLPHYSIEADTIGGYRLPISTSKWGATMWDAMHFVSLGYPEDRPSKEVQEAAYHYMASLPFLLPCLLCRIHLSETYQQDMPLTPSVFESKEAFGSYIVKLRDLVKRRHACPSCRNRQHSFAVDVEDRLLRSTSSSSIDIPWHCLILTLSLLFYVLYRQRKNGIYS